MTNPTTPTAPATAPAAAPDGVPGGVPGGVPTASDGAAGTTSRAAPLLPAPDVLATLDVPAQARASGTRFVFIDTEATGLDHQRHELTEVAWIVRFEDGRQAVRHVFPTHTTDGADADALELTHYHERIAPQPKTPASTWLPVLLADARDAVLVGAVPDFDARHLERMCRKLGVNPTWDHHLLDVETLALPLLAAGPEAPRSLARTCEALGIPHDRDQAHGALYDALQAMRAFDRIWDRLIQLRADDAPLPPAIPPPRRNGNHAPPTAPQTTPPTTPAPDLPPPAAADRVVDAAMRPQPPTGTEASRT